MSIGRSSGGDFMEIAHVPSGVKRRCPPPLGGAAVQRETRMRFLREIEAELVAKGLNQYIDDEENFQTIEEQLLEHDLPNFPDCKMRLYEAFIWKHESDAVGVRASVLASNLDDARQKLEAEHGEGTVYYLHNEDDANQPR